MLLRKPVLLKSIFLRYASAILVSICNFGWAGCDDKESSEVDENQNEESGSDTETPENPHQPLPLPEGCDGEIFPLFQDVCVQKLIDLCQAQSTEQGCSQQGPFLFRGGRNAIVCGWAKKVTFSNLQTCSVTSVVGRCYAGYHEQLLPGCGDPCSGENLDNNRLEATPNGLDLIEMPCLLGTKVNTIGSDALSCHEDDPDRPALCQCVEAACAAGEGAVYEPNKTIDMTKSFFAPKPPKPPTRERGRL